ncbi:MAG: U32 family peptidase, partial [Christensenellales bacterium]
MTFDQIEAMYAAIGGEIELETFIMARWACNVPDWMLDAFQLPERTERGTGVKPALSAGPIRCNEKRTRPDEAMPIEEDEHGTAILSSRDICMMDHLPRLMESGVCCFKDRGADEEGTEIYVARLSARIGGRWMPTRRIRKPIRQMRRCKSSFGSAAGSNQPPRLSTMGFYSDSRVCGEAVGVTQEAEYMGYVLDVSGGEALV